MFFKKCDLEKQIGKDYFIYNNFEKIERIVMKKLFYLFCCLTMAVFSGCAMFGDNTEEKESPEVVELNAEKAIGEKMLVAFKKNDAKAFLQYVPAGNAGKYGAKEFTAERKEITSRLGEIASFRFLTKLELEPVHQLVWAVRFKRKNIEQKDIYQEVLFTIVVGKVDESRKVFLFGFR